MMNLASDNAKALDISKTAMVLEGNGLKELLLPPGYKSFPEVSMLRYDQERGKQFNKERVRIPKPGNIRQAAPVKTGPVIVKKVMTINVPSWELAGMKAVQEETERRELARLKADQEEEFARLQAEQREAKSRQVAPTSLVGAVRALNIRNADVKVLS